MTRIAVLGSTGSIGTQTLDIVRQHPDKLQVVALAANSNGQQIKEQCAEFGCRTAALMNLEAAHASGLPGGLEAVSNLATLPQVDLVVVSVAGVIGLVPTLNAIQAGKKIALASKEVLVAAGELVMPLVRENNITLTPIDSEHSAVFQCLQGYSHHQIEKLILTASGGPFRGKTQADLETVTAREALNHPTWTMGGKITVDSATLMNKGLELIEAKWLFGVDMDQVDFVIHPQSIVHSFVQFKDTSVLGQFGWPDMRIAIQYALLFPERSPNQLKPWNPVESGDLTFQTPDFKTFKCPSLARMSVEAGGTMPSVMNAANEEAANLFLLGQCGFLQIADVVEEVMSRHQPVPVNLESVLDSDRWARETLKTILKLQ